MSRFDNEKSKLEHLVAPMPCTVKNQPDGIAPATYELFRSRVFLQGMALRPESSGTARMSSRYGRAFLTRRRLCPSRARYTRVGRMRQLKLLRTRSCVAGLGWRWLTPSR